jgi:hypothetical protein
MLARTPSDSGTAEQIPGQDLPRYSSLSAARAWLGQLFPEAPEPGPSSRRRRLAAVALQAGLVLAGALAMLPRSAGTPAWQTIYAEDYGIFLIQAIQHPWQLFIPYAGYLQLFPRLVAQLVTYLPLTDAAREFAAAGALIGAASALVVYHASAGLIRSRWLRLMLGAAVVLLPVAPLEIIDSGVDLAWYTMMALFFAVLWRPHARTGMAVAALVAFVTASSDTMAVAFVPLFALRLFVLRRPRDHAVTAGWLAGCVLQAPVMFTAISSGDGSRLTGRHATLRQSLHFYGHDVALPSAGWRFSWWLRHLAGANDATTIMLVVLGVVFGTILVWQARSRAFVLTALVTGFLYAVLASTLTWWVAVLPATPSFEPGARYTALPIFLIEAAAIVAVDHKLRVGRMPGAGTPLRGIAGRLLPVLAVAVLVAVLGSAWTADFRYRGARSSGTLWAPQVSRWESACRESVSGVITVHPSGEAVASLPCDRLRF